MDGFFQIRGGEFTQLDLLRDAIRPEDDRERQALGTISKIAGKVKIFQATNQQWIGNRGFLAEIRHFVGSIDADTYKLNTI